jgi:GntR family transcriptional regulator
VLLEQGVQIAFAVTHVRPRLLSARERTGQTLGVQGATAVLELEEIMHVGSGEAVQHSCDLFGPGGLDLQVRRNLEVAAPAPLVRALGRSAGG